MSQPDSPLSIAASITGILTFTAAVLAGFYAHTISLKNAIDTQAEVASALEKIYFLETETNMLNNAYLASQVRHPERKTGSGDFKYFHGLYGHSLERMRQMDRDLREDVTLITGGDGYGKISRVRSAAAWMTARDRVQRAIEERRAESTRIFQIQLAILSAKIDALSYSQNHHNTNCSILVEEVTPRDPQILQNSKEHQRDDNMEMEKRYMNAASVKINIDADGCIGTRPPPSAIPILSTCRSSRSPADPKKGFSSEISQILTAIRPPVNNPLSGPSFSDYHFPLMNLNLEERPSTAPPV